MIYNNGPPGGEKRPINCPWAPWADWIVYIVAEAAGEYWPVSLERERER